MRSNINALKTEERTLSFLAFMKQNKNRHRNPRLREGRRVIHTPAGLFSPVAAVIALDTSRAVKASPVILRPCTPRSDTHCHAPTLAPPVSGGLLQLAECCHGTNRDKCAEPRGRDPARSRAGNGETRHHCPAGDRGPEHLPGWGARRLHADTEPPAHALQACTGCRIWTAQGKLRGLRNTGSVYTADQ